MKLLFVAFLRDGAGGARSALRFTCHSRLGFPATTHTTLVKGGPCWPSGRVGGTRGSPGEPSELLVKAQECVCVCVLTPSHLPSVGWQECPGR